MWLSVDYTTYYNLQSNIFNKKGLILIPGNIRVFEDYSEFHFDVYHYSVPTIYRIFCTVYFTLTLGFINIFEFFEGNDKKYGPPPSIFGLMIKLTNFGFNKGFQRYKNKKDQKFCTTEKIILARMVRNTTLD